MSIKEEANTFVAEQSSSDHDTLFSSSKGHRNQFKKHGDSLGPTGGKNHWNNQSSRGHWSKKPKNLGKKDTFSPNVGSPQKDSSSSRMSPKGKNPLDSDGEITRCHHCQSINHWMPNCPDLAAEKVSEDTLFNHEVILCEGSLDTPMVNDLVAESLNCALLDSGASKNVCGRLWLDLYVDSLPESEKMKLKSEPSGSVFRFGDGNKVESSKVVTIPATLGSRNISISTDVIDKDIPYEECRSEPQL